VTGRDRVTEGRLVEVPTPDATGMDRRAFGEFASHRGELASYAVGWVSGGDERVGRLTIGMGAGNPGGGTFHMAVGVGEDGRYGLRLVDEPGPESVEVRNELGFRILTPAARNDEALDQHLMAAAEARGLGALALEAESLRLQGWIHQSTSRREQAHQKGRLRRRLRRGRSRCSAHLTANPDRPRGC